MNFKLNDNKKKSINSTAGITLVALVVTIVVLLILAGISLNLVLGQNGIIAKAKDAKDKSEQDASNTDMALQGLESEMLEQLGESSGGNGGTGELPAQVNVGVKATSNSTINGQAASATNPIIPEGYYAINVGEATWNGEGGPAYNKGLVITDSLDGSGNSNGNEWVWVPVTDASIMYETADSAISLTGSTGKNTTKYSKSRIISGMTDGSGNELYTRVLPGNTGGFREPDLLVQTDGFGSPIDNDSNAITAGFSSLADMATKLVSDYETMITSIERYHGFYIGRYELTSSGEKAGETLTNTNWYQLYANCKSLAASNQAITRMIWGCQWDVTCNWLISSGAKTSNEVLTDSSSWGNYATLVSSGSGSGSGSGLPQYEETKKNTGSSTEYMANNIYDLAGNYYEWTQETYNEIGRVVRGGSYNSTNNKIVSYRNNFYQMEFSTIDSLDGVRFSLYFNSETIISRV